jgi:hypothetical protein
LSSAIAKRDGGLDIIVERTLEAVAKGVTPLVKSEHEATALITTAAISYGLVA